MKIEKNMRSNVAKVEIGNQGPKGVGKGIKGIEEIAVLNQLWKERGVWDFCIKKWYRSHFAIT